jgi:hypothetical protein
MHMKGFLALKVPTPGSALTSERAPHFHSKVLLLHYKYNTLLAICLYSRIALSLVFFAVPVKQPLIILPCSCPIVPRYILYW